MSYNGFIADFGTIAMGTTTYQWIIENHRTESWAYNVPV